MSMIDISGKEMTERMAEAEGKLVLKPTTIKVIQEKRIKKGDPFKAGEIAALLAVKKTPSMIPHCHPIPITSISLNFEIHGRDVLCTCCVKANYSTGVEMEALTGVSVALLTVWDMVKYLEKDRNGQYPETRINTIRVIRKLKGAVDGKQRT